MLGRVLRDGEQSERSGHARRQRIVRDVILIGALEVMRRRELRCLKRGRITADVREGEQPLDGVSVLLEPMGEVGAAGVSRRVQER